MLTQHYFKNKDNLNELKALLADPKVTNKQICNKYGFSRQRLYQIQQAYGLHTRHRTNRNAFTLKYGNNPIMYALTRALKERKRHYAERNLITTIQDATLDELLFEGSLPRYCPVFGIELCYENTEHLKDSSPSIDKIDNTKGYIKGNVALISWRANKIKNEGTVKEHEQIITYMKSHGIKV